MDLAEIVYELSKLMPKEERYRMTSQMLRSAASVPANIAEGYQRATRKDYAHFISIARGSLAETEPSLCWRPVWDCCLRMPLRRHLLSPTN